MSRRSAFVGVDVGTTGAKAVAYAPGGLAPAQGIREVVGMPTAYPLSGVAASVAPIFFLVMRLKLCAFVTLLIMSCAAAVAAGVPLGETAGKVEKGTGDAPANAVQASNLPVVALAFVAAALARVSPGSATVSVVTWTAMVTTVGLVGFFTALPIGLLL